MIMNEQISKIGSTLKPHGIKGEINILHDEFCELNDFSCIVLSIEGINVPFFMESIRPKNHEISIVKLKGFDNEIEVGELSGLEVYALNNELPLNEDESEEGMYPEDFIGYHVVDEKRILLGKVVDVDVSTENALFIVEKSNNEEFFIPIADEYFVDINTETKTIQMELPSGLLDI